MNKNRVALSILLCWSGCSLSTSLAQESIPAFDTWCPGGSSLKSEGNGHYYVNGKKAKHYLSSSEGVVLTSGDLSFKVEKFQDGIQVTVSGRPDATGQCSVKGTAMHIGPPERAGQGIFNATGQIPCALTPSQPSRQCNFGVARDPGGNASIRVQLDENRFRFITFENVKPIGADLTQADGTMHFSYKKVGDLYFIEAGHERFEIPEAVVTGG